MFCAKCGKQIADTTKFCPYCGADCSPVGKVIDQANQMFNAAEQELGNAINDVKQNFTQSNANQQYGNSSQYSAGQQYNANQNTMDNNQYNGQQFNGQQFNGQQSNGQQFNGQQYYGNQNYNNGYNQPPYGVQRLKTDRSLALFIILSIITCGIYGYYFIYQMAHDVNIACDGDGESTSGLVVFILLSIVTCGIYTWFWYYKLGNRLAANGGRYGLMIQENGTTVLLWCVLGMFVCGLGQYVAMYILIKNANLICSAYNRTHGLG